MRTPSPRPLAVLGFNSEAAERTSDGRDGAPPELAPAVVAPTPSAAAAEGGVTALVDVPDDDGDGR